MSASFEDLHPRDPMSGEFIDKESTRDEHGQLFDMHNEALKSERAKSLIADGYTPAVASRTHLDPRRIHELERQQWWGGNFVNAEYNAEDGSYPQMPDDFTPKRTLGRALSGHRRTHRMKYEGKDTTLRMPSATSVKGFAAENGGTFDVPVSVETPNGTMNGWVRVTKGANGAWSSKAMGFGDSEVYVGESVRAVLEARHPSTALYEAGDILERYRSREAMEGVAMEERQSFIKGIGYDEKSKTAFVSMGGVTKSGEEKTYAYGDVEPSEYRALAEAESTGRAYNKEIKSKREGERAHQCPKCSRFMAKGGAHVCPVPKTPRVTSLIDHNEAAEERAKMLLDGASAKGAAETRPAIKTQTDPAKPDIRTWAREEWRAAAKAEKLDKAASSDFGPTVKRGFTMQPEVVDAVSPFTDQTHVPSAFRVPDGKRVGYSNGDTGLMRFSGVGHDAAGTLVKSLPEPNLKHRASAGAPSVGTTLSAVANSGGRMEAHGWVVPPNRTDERVDVNGVIVYSDTDDANRAKWEASKMGLHEAGMTPPKVCRQVEVPYRPGEKAWLMAW